MSKLGFHIHKNESTFLQFTTNQCLLKNVAKKDINLAPEISHQKEKYVFMLQKLSTSFLKKENPLRYDPQCVQTDKKIF